MLSVWLLGYPGYWKMGTHLYIINNYEIFFEQETLETIHLERDKCISLQQCELVLKFSGKIIAFRL